MSSRAIQSLKQPRKERLSDQIYNQIKELVISENIQVGEKLPAERELCSQLGVSRVVIREALRSLEQSGIIEIKTGPQGGAFVVNSFFKPFFNSIYDLANQGKITLHHFFEVRKEIECLSIRLAARKSNDQDIRKLEAINQKMSDDINEKTKLQENNMDFHVAIANISGNPLIKLVVQSLITLLNNHFQVSRYTIEFSRNTIERHKAIIKAMKEKNIELCEKLMEIDTRYTKNAKREA